MHSVPPTPAASEMSATEYSIDVNSSAELSPDELVGPCSLLQSGLADC